MRPIHAVALALTLAGCSVRVSRDAPGLAAAPDDTAAARAAIAAAARDFSARYERGDVAGMIALYTPDGVILPPGRPAIRGTEALRAYWTLPPNFRVLEHRVTADSVVVAGPVAYDWGTYRVRTRNAEGAERETNGKYVIVWREVAAGDWRMHVDIWNDTRQPPAPAPAARP